MQPQARELTEEQIAAAISCRGKWQLIAASTRSINPDQCIELVRCLYKTIEKDKPEVHFYESPFKALKANESLLKISPDFHDEYSKLERSVENNLSPNCNLTLRIWNQLEAIKNSDDVNQWMGVNYSLMNQLMRNFRTLGDITPSCWIRPTENIFNSRCQQDFLISTLKCTPQSKDWELLKHLDEQMGWYMLLPEICIVSDRPRILQFDEQQKIHGDGEPAIAFADGYSLYAYHGTVLPARYGRISSSQWDPKWLLENMSDTLRRILIQGMEFATIKESLNLSEIDAWGKYCLLRVKNLTKGKPIVLLTQETAKGIVTHSVSHRLVNAKKAKEWLHQRYCQEDSFSGS